MYLIAIHVPIYVRGNTKLLGTDWKRSLELLRDSLHGQYGDIHVVAPSLDATSLKTDQALDSVDAKLDGIHLYPSFPFNSRAREYWTKYRTQWYHDVNALVPGSSVIHGAFDDCYRPIAWDAFKLAIRHRKPTVFVQDTDHVGKLEASLASVPLKQRIERLAYKTIYESRVKEGVKLATLSLLKGQDLHRRYGRFAKNAKNFHDTSYFTSEIVQSDSLKERLTTLTIGSRPVRLVYCGRLEARKGVDHSVMAVAKAGLSGANVTLDIIGDGAERAKLEELTRNLGAGHLVKFHGQKKYGPELLRELAGYDGLLFTPQCEDTPRMIFDGYSAGLPLIAYDIPYVAERKQEEKAALTAPVGDVGAMAQLLTSLDKNRKPLVHHAQNAYVAARYHAADEWYKRRAAWTIEAVSQHKSA